MNGFADFGPLPVKRSQIPHTDIGIWYGKGLFALSLALCQHSFIKETFVISSGFAMLSIFLLSLCSLAVGLARADQVLLR